MNKEYTTSEKCKIVKEYLKSKFLGKKIGVTKGSGTASGWIYISLPEDMRTTHTYAEYKNMTRTALENKGTEPYTFDSDDGWGSRSDCISITFNN